MDVLTPGDVVHPRMRLRCVERTENVRNQNGYPAEGDCKETSSATQRIMYGCGIRLEKAIGGCVGTERFAVMKTDKLRIGLGELRTVTASTVDFREIAGMFRMTVNLSLVLSLEPNHAAGQSC